MELQLLIVSLAFLLFMLLSGKNIKLKFLRKNSSLPPGPWKLPLIGSMIHMIGSLPHHALRNLSRKYGPIMHLKIGELELIVISSPETAKEIMKTKDLNFASRPNLYVSSLGGYGLTGIALSPYGEYWRQLKKIAVLELLSAKRVKNFSSIRENVISNMIGYVSSRNDMPINLTKMFLGVTNTIVFQAICSEKCRNQEELISALVELSKLASGFSIGEIFPSIKYLDVISGMKSRFVRSFHRLDGILNEIIREHQAHATFEREKEDILDTLLRIKKDGSIQVLLTMNGIKHVITELFIAGTETSSTLMEWAMAELARKPEVMAKAQAEVRGVLKEGSDNITESDLTNLKYLKMIIKETLRLHPPLGLLLPRVCRKTCKVNGYEIPKGMKIIINAWAIGRHPDYWDDADSFNPERFEDNNLDVKGSDFELLPFGAGRRICPGISFGLGVAELVLAQLLFHFDWELPENTKPSDLDMTEAFGSAVVRKKELLLIASPHFVP